MSQSASCPRLFRVRALDVLARDMRILRIAPADGSRLAFAAGQYLRLFLAPGLHRDFSIASTPDADGTATEVEFHIRLSNGSGSRYIAEQLAVGDTLHVAGPLGTAFWPGEHDGMVLLVAGGSGLAPMLAIAEAASASRRTPDIVLYAGLRTVADLYCAPRLAALAAANPRFRYVLLLSDEAPPDASWRAGVPGDAIRADFTQLAATKAFLAGPAAMIEHTVPTLLALGLRAEDIHSDGY